MRSFERHTKTGTSTSEAGNETSSSRSRDERCAASPELTFIAGITARDHSIKVFIGPKGGGSFANLDTKEIVLDPADCDSVEKRRFVAAHEGAHIGETLSLHQLGMTKQEIKAYSAKIGICSLRNVIEDGAINDRFCIQYPTLQRDTLASYPRVDPTQPIGLLNLPEVQQVAQLLGRIPRFAQGLAGLLQDWSELRHTCGFNRSLGEYQAQPRQGGSVADPEVLGFFDEVLQEARHAISKIPRPGDPVSASFERSKERHIWVENVLYPGLKKLVDSDLKELTRRLVEAAREEEGEGSDDGASGQAKKPLSGPEARRQAREILARLDDGIRAFLESLKDKVEKSIPSTSEVIREQNEKERDAEVARERAQQAANAEKKLKETLLASLPPYHREFREISAMLEESYNRLMDIFDPARHFSWQIDQPSGSRLNIQRAMELELTGQGYDRVWMRQVDPQYPDLAVALLLDRSGSMGDGVKDLQARRALIFAKELFERLDIPTACCWHAQSSDVSLTFEDDIRDEIAQEKLMSETAALNQGQDDALGVRTAANLLREHSSTKKVVVVLSDAQACTGEELRALVRELALEQIPVLHFGLGPGTADTQGYYIHSWGNLELKGNGSNDFLTVFCREMERLAQGALDGPATK